MVARDLLQNYFDANRDQVEKIITKVDGSLARIEAPAPSDLWRLYYLGSEKGLDSVGQYGEGFKATAVSYLRFPGRMIYAVSGNSAIAIYPSDEPIPGTTKLFPLIYSFFEIEPVVGSVLIMEGCSQSLATTLGTALANFFYATNPCRGEKLWHSPKLDVYRTKGADGAIFYRSLKRGTLKGIGIVLVLKQPYQDVEKRIGSDRDRKEFSNVMRDYFLQLICNKFVTRNVRLQMIILNEFRAAWESGHGNALLEIMSRGCCWDMKHETAALISSSRFFASSTEPSGAEARMMSFSDN